jgi:hypothetical protein
MSNIHPFGTSTDSPTLDGTNSKTLKVIKAFGCTVVSFDVSADWGSQAGSLSLTLIEDQADGDRLSIPVIGSPFIFELKEDDDTEDGLVIFEYIGLVSEFSRSASASQKTYSATISSPLTVLDAAKVIMDGYTGLGGSQEGSSDFTGYGNIDFGSKNSSIVIDNTAGSYHWFNVSNLINVFGILENDDSRYAVPRNDSSSLNPLTGKTFFGDFGFSSVSQDGIPLVNLIWALHLGINHMPKVSESQQLKTHGGNLLYGRQNYNINSSFEGIPYFFDFDAIHFYNQIVDKLGPQFRVPGPISTINEIVSFLCQEANFEYFCYIDINKTDGFGSPTLREVDENWAKTSNCSWDGLDERKFTDGGKYGGTIRIQTVDKNSFFNSSRPFSNIAYNLLGLEVPDLNQSDFTSATGSHPGKRPGQPNYGFADNSGIYMDPLDSEGLDSQSDGFTEVGTESLANGGNFPTTTGLFDVSQMDNLKIVNSNVSLRGSDTVTMKVVTGGNQSRIVSAPRSLIRHYWGDISLINRAVDPRTTNDTETDEYGLNEDAVTKIPVVTQLLDPRDVDDYIFIDMQSIFGNLSINNALHDGVYAASMFEIRLAMTNFDQWVSWFIPNKNIKYDKIKNYFYPSCVGWTGVDYNAQLAATKTLNSQSGIGYITISDILGCTNPFSAVNTSHEVYNFGFDESGLPKDNIAPSGSGVTFPSGLFSTGVPCWLADMQLRKTFLPKMHEVIKNIGDTHYGKSWYVPVPYHKTKTDLDGNNLVGNYTRSWELSTAGYVEPSLYYSREIPQSNKFIKDGLVSPHVNYDNDFIYSDTGTIFDDAYTNDLVNPINGINNQVYNFSEYSLDSLAFTKYGDRSIKHAAPQNIEDGYSFLPYGYDSLYSRDKIKFTSLAATGTQFYPSGAKTPPVAPQTIPNRVATLVTNAVSYLGLNPTLATKPSAGNTPPTGIQTPNPYGWPWQTESELFSIFDSIKSLSYPDNGDFCFPFLKVETSRVYLPIMKNSQQFDDQDVNYAALSRMVGSKKRNMRKAIKAPSQAMLKPYPVCVAPRSINYAQRSTRYVYGPWMTSLSVIPFRGKVEYEQDDSLVPENFLIPLNFGEFGDFTLSQTSGLTGLDLAAQGRANAIDDFALFAQEQGSITIQSPPEIKRIGDSLYGIQQVTDIKVSVNNSQITTSYTFKTISPRFGKNNKDIEKKLTKISNRVNKLKLI